MIVATTKAKRSDDRNLDERRKTGRSESVLPKRKRKAAAANVPSVIMTMMSLPVPIPAAAVPAAVMTVEDENEKRRARKRRNEKVENGPPKIAVTMTTIPRRGAVPFRERKSKCTLKRMPKIWPMNVPEKKFCNITILPSNECTSQIGKHTVNNQQYRLVTCMLPPPFAVISLTAPVKKFIERKKYH